MTKEELSKLKEKIELLKTADSREKDLYLRAISLDYASEMKGYPSIDKPWLKWFKEDCIGLPFIETSAYDYFLEMTKNFPQSTILLEYYGRNYTISDIKREVEYYIKCFSAMGLKKGDVVSFVMLDVPEVLFMWYALTSLGVISNMIKFDESGERIKYMTELTNSKYIFATSVPFIIKNVKDALENNNIVEKVITLEVTEALPLPLKTRMLFEELKLSHELKQNIKDNGNLKQMAKDIKKTMSDLKKSKNQVNELINDDARFLSFKKWKESLTIKDQIPIISKNGDDIATIVYTGGTTGKPKGVKLSNNNLNAAAHAIHYGDDTFSLGNSALNILPPAIAYFFNSTHGNFCGGVKVILISHFTVEEYPYLIKKYEPNIFMAGPILLEKIRKANIIKDASFMKAPISGGDKLYEDEEEAWNKIYPLVHQGWGMSEASAASSYAKTNSYKFGSIGVPLLTVMVSVFDYGTDIELPYNQIGELCVTGPTIMQGYFDNEEETKKVLKLHRDGRIWLHTDDLGFMDEEGHIFHRGRAKRMLTRNGNKVWLTEIEDLASKNPNVDKCCCVKCEDIEEREVPVLHLVLNENSDSIETVVNEIKKEIEEKLGNNYVPKFYVLRDDLIYSTVNKKCDFKELEKENIFDLNNFEQNGDIIKKIEGIKLVRE